MSEMAPEYRLAACRWNGRDQPRTIPGRHAEDCNAGDCAGCQPCENDHCRVCESAHAPGTCADCMDETRDYLHGIARMAGALPEEVEHRGIDSEAMVLAGPVADPEARGHLEASYAAGRIGPDEIEAAHVRECEEPTCGGCAPEYHPEYVCLSWQMVWREALDHDEAPDSSLDTAIAYLNDNLTYMGGYPYVEFKALRDDLRRCHTHLEAVLHDGEQRETGAPCMTCHKPLERVWGDSIVGAKGDGWRCPKCHQTSTDEQYRFAVMHLHREEAAWLTDRDMQVRTGVKAGTVRSWARTGTELVRKRRDQERTVYSVEDVLTVAKNKGLVA